MAKPSVPGSLRSVVLQCVPCSCSLPPRRRVAACWSKREFHRCASAVWTSKIQHAEPAELIVGSGQGPAVAQQLDPVKSDAEITAVLGCDSVLILRTGVRQAWGLGKRSSVGSGWRALRILLTGHCLIRRGQPERRLVGRWRACATQSGRDRGLWPVENRCNVQVGLPGGARWPLYDGGWLLFQRDRPESPLVASGLVCCGAAGLRCLIRLGSASPVVS